MFRFPLKNFHTSTQDPAVIELLLQLKFYNYDALSWKDT